MLPIMFMRLGPTNPKPTGLERPQDVPSAVSDSDHGEVVEPWTGGGLRFGPSQEE
jgi:hypothetical protein